MILEDFQTWAWEIYVNVGEVDPNLFFFYLNLGVVDLCWTWWT